MSNSHRIGYIADFVQRHGWTKGAEIGVFRGRIVYGLLEACPGLFMVGVDSWVILSGEGDRTSTGLVRYETWNIEDEGKKFRAECLEKYGDRTKIFHMSSLSAAQLVKDCSLDFVQIDADHRNSFVRADIAAWWPKIKVGGRMFGHDWNSFGSVRKAVNQFKDLTVDEKANIWSIPRKKGNWPC